MESTKLDNGLTLCMQEDHTVPLVTLDMWVRVGSGDEPSELAGISHFLEHMMFKGTEKLKTGEYDLHIEEVGGYLNAATSMDYTRYYVTAPSEHFDRILSDFADVMLNSTLAREEVERERLVVLEEIRRKADNPFGYLFDRSIPSIFESGPYTHPVIGSKETVRAITRDQLYDHYRRFYTADNMFLCIVGDIDTKAVAAAVGKAFAGAEATRHPYRQAAPETRYALPGTSHLERKWNEAYFILGFPGPADAGLHEMAVVEYAETLLAAGRSARLVNALQEKKGLVSSIGAHFPVNRHEMPLLIYGTCEPEKIPAVRAAVEEELRRLVDDGFNGREFKRTRRQVLNGHLFSLETNAGRAMMLGHSQILYGDCSLVSKYEGAIKSVDSGDVRTFLKEYLREGDRYFFVTARGNGANGER